MPAKLTARVKQIRDGIASLNKGDYLPFPIKFSERNTAYNKAGLCGFGIGIYKIRHIKRGTTYSVARLT